MRVLLLQVVHQGTVRASLAGERHGLHPVGDQAARAAARLQVGAPFFV